MYVPLSGCCHGITLRMRLHIRHLVFSSQRAPEESPGHDTHTNTLSKPTAMERQFPWLIIVWISPDLVLTLDYSTTIYQWDFKSALIGSKGIFNPFLGIGSFFFFGRTTWIWLGSALDNVLRWLRAVQWLACRMTPKPFMSTTGRHAVIY